MSEHESIQREVALAVASEVLQLIGDVIERSTIAGSLRRGLDMVHDVEIVCVGRSIDIQPGLFGNVDEAARRNTLDDRIAELIEAGTFRPRIAKDGKQAVGTRYKRLWYLHYPVDIFSPPAESFGAQLAIRTGPSNFSRLCVTKRSEGGAMPFGMKQENGALWRGRQVVPTLEEADWFDALSLPVWEPSERSEQRLRDHLRERRMAAR